MGTRPQRSPENDPSTREDRNVQEYGTRILGGSGSILSGSVIGKGISFGLNLALTRGLGKSLYGLYSLGLTLLRIFREIASLGFQNGIVRFGAPQLEEGRLSDLKGTLVASGAIGLLSGIVIGGGLFSFSTWIANRVFGDPELSPVIAIFACGLPFYVFTYLASRMARALGNMQVDALLSSVLQPAYFLLLVAGLLLAELDFLYVLFAFLTSTILAAGTSLYAIYRLLPRAIARVAPQFQIRRLIRFSLPILGVTLANTGLAYTDRIMIGILAGSGAVGVYQAAATLATQMRFALSSINASFSPLISELYQKGDVKSLSQLYADTVRWVLTITIPAGIVLISFAPHIMAIFGSDFRDGGVILQVLSLSYLIITGVGSVGYMLQMSDHQDTVFVINMSMSASNLFLNWILIQQFGALGAAIATGGIQVAGNLAQLTSLYAFVGVQPFRGDLWKPLAAAAVACLATWGTNFLFQGTLRWAAGIPIVVTTYVLAILGLGLHPRDQVLVRSIWGQISGG